MYAGLLKAFTVRPQISHLFEPIQAKIHLKQNSASTPEQRYAAAYLYTFVINQKRFHKFKNTG